MRPSPTSLSRLGGSVVLDDPLESVDADDFMREAELFEHVAVVPLVEPADMDSENPAITIAATIAVRNGNLRRRPVATFSTVRPSGDFTDLLTSPPS